MLDYSLALQLEQPLQVYESRIETGWRSREVRKICKATGACTWGMASPRLDRPSRRQIFDWSTFEAGHIDVTIACMGLSRLVEGEEMPFYPADICFPVRVPGGMKQAQILFILVDTSAGRVNLTHPATIDVPCQHGLREKVL